MLPCAALADPAGPAFSFSAYPSFLSHFSLSGGENGFLPLGFSAVSGFAHNCPTRLQQGRKLVLLVSFSIPASKIAHRPHTGFSLFCSVSLPTFPLRGKAGLFSNLGCPGFARLAHNCPTRLNRAGNPFRWCRSPTRPPKTAHRLSQGQFGFHRLFWCASFTVGRPNSSPVCNLPLPE